MLNVNYTLRPAREHNLYFQPRVSYFISLKWHQKYLNISVKYLFHIKIHDSAGCH